MANKKSFVACGKSDVTATLATRSRTVDMAEKWQLKSGKLIAFGCEGCLWNTLRKPR
jgi:hypothetical protein